MCTQVLNRMRLNREEQVIVDYLEDHDNWAWLKALSKYFTEKTGLRGRSTLNKKLKLLNKKDIILRKKTYGKETIITLVKSDQTNGVLDSQIRRFTVLLQEFKGLFDNQRANNENRFAFMIEFSIVILLERLECSIISNRMNMQNKEITRSYIAKLEKLEEELTSLIIDKCKSDTALSDTFIRQFPTVAGPRLLLLHSFIDALKETDRPIQRKPQKVKSTGGRN